MDINLLVKRLRHGDSYTVQNDTGDSYQVNTPPNHLMLKAAEIIVSLNQQLQLCNEVTLNLQRQLNELAEQHELLQKFNAVAEPSNTD